MASAAFFGTLAVIVVRFLRAVPRGTYHHRMVSTTAGLVYAFCLYLPATYQAAGQLPSKLAAAGVLGPPTGADVTGLCLRWSLELWVVLTAEHAATVVVSTAQALPVTPARPRRRPWLAPYAPATVAVLVFVGLLATLAFPPADLADRADGGQGAQTILRSFLVCGLALGVHVGGVARIRTLAVTLGGAAYLVAQSVRSPLVLVFFALLVQRMNARGARRVSPAEVARLGVLAVAVALAAAFMSVARANETRGLGLSTGEIVAQVEADPVLAVLEAGIDTLDGYRLARAVAPEEPAHPGDLVNVVTTFVPRALWPDKPTTLPVDVSARYLGYRASGQFLSPVGYLRLMTGSYPGGLAGLAVLAFLAALAVIRVHGSFWEVLVTYGTFRFLLGGSSFDIYYVLALAVPVLLSRALVGLAAQAGLLPPEAVTAPPPARPGLPARSSGP
ncbi:MAG TPA: hypothetical protein VI248_17945 [Kineosporiaceae bacterium]